MKYFILTILVFSSPLFALTEKETIELIKLVDDRQRNSGDYSSLCYIKDKEKDKEAKLNEALVFRRDTDDKFMILFTKPKEDAGKGYLKIDKNLWNYDPKTGKWERRTEREKIGGTNSRREDFDESRLAEEYTSKYEREEKLDKYTAYVITLSVKPKIDVAYPVIKLWVDKETKNILKREEYSLSNKLMRTSYYPKWYPKYSDSKKGEVWVPETIIINDELIKGNFTIIQIDQNSVDLKSLPANMFTKAWIESKSR